MGHLVDKGGFAHVGDAQHHDPHGAAHLAPIGPGRQLVPQQLPDGGGKLGGACTALGIGLQDGIALSPEIRRPAAGLAGVCLVYPVQHHQAGLPRRQFVHIRVPAGQGNARVQNFAHRIHILDFCRDHPPGLGHVPGEPAEIVYLHIYHLLRILHNHIIISYSRPLGKRKNACTQQAFVLFSGDTAYSFSLTLAALPTRSRR